MALRRVLGAAAAPCRAAARICRAIQTAAASPYTSALQYQMDLDSSTDVYKDRKTKIVCTLGPSSSTPAQISQLLVSGLDVARINCAHGDRASYSKLVGALREASADVAARGMRSIDLGISRPDVGIAALAFDIKGPEIRIGRFAASVPSSHGSRTIPLARGERLLLSTDPSLADCSTKDTGIYVSYPLLAKHTRPGSRIYVVSARAAPPPCSCLVGRVLLLPPMTGAAACVTSLPVPLIRPRLQDDGNVELEVVETDVASGRVVVTVLTDTPLLERKGVNLPGEWWSRVIDADAARSRSGNGTRQAAPSSRALAARDL